MPNKVKCVDCINLKNDWCEKVADSPCADMVRDCKYFSTVTDAPELKPCPFCGGEAKLKHGYPNRQDGKRREAFVQCRKCGAKTQTVSQLPFMSWKDVDRYAVEAWNRRGTDGRKV